MNNYKATMYTISSRTMLLLTCLTCMSLLWGCDSQETNNEVIRQKIYLHESRQEYDKAIAAISELIKKYPKDAVLYFDRGVFYDSKKDYEAALEQYNLAIKLNPQEIRAHNNRVLSSLMRKITKTHSSILMKF